MLQERINNSILPFIKTDDLDRCNRPVPVINDTENEIEKAIELLDKLNGAELQQFVRKFNKKFEEVKRNDNNFMMHDFVDDYLYIVYFQDGAHYTYCKGEDAYSSYKSCGIRLERKTKELFPTYEVLLEKAPVAEPYRPNQKSKKELQKMGKQKYDLAYQKDNIKQVKFTLNKNTDQDIIKKLDTVQNKNGYLKDLIRQDIKKTG